MTTTPLPQKTCIGVGYFDEYLFAYTEDQMIEYGKRCFAEGMSCRPASGSQYPRTQQDDKDLSLFGEAFERIKNESAAR